MTQGGYIDCGRSGWSVGNLTDRLASEYIFDTVELKHLNALACQPLSSLAWPTYAPNSCERAPRACGNAAGHSQRVIVLTDDGVYSLVQSLAGKH